MKSLTMALLLTGALAAPALSAADAGVPYAVAQHYALGGAGGWDYLSLDASSHRLFIARDDRVMVVDAGTGKLLGEIPGMQHAHGIALQPATHQAFVSNGHGDNVSVVDTETLKVTGHIALTGKDPDAIVFDDASGHLLTMNGHSSNISVIDAKAGKELATITVPGRPEFAVSDGKGQLFLNLEDKHQLARVDLTTRKVLNVWPLAPCEGPTGLALDTANHRLFSVCDNGWMIVTDASDGHQVAKLPIGKGPDAVAFDAQRHVVLSSNGDDGTLSVIAQDSADHYRVLGHVKTQPSARTLALDPQNHTVYLAAASSAVKGKPVDGFGVLVVAPH
ncbi:YncE family protein [Dyella subtropica]|uniref:YncE family protein n=1 Tax=Dyella subtropica TaxID=2992127 RepID=UPI00224D1868|nr:YncE family protein [Dyella subtropica]